MTDYRNITGQYNAATVSTTLTLEDEVERLKNKVNRLDRHVGILRFFITIVGIMAVYTILVIS